ncbi:MAG TPA: VWA domain-containing protein, partial [Ignavibacteriaceae bacterium]|nr:VWA domain-containing protein [Ignavibacteriaceae bacterium]
KAEPTKQRIAAELSAILAFSALKNNDKVGLILFTDKIEKFVPPRKGKKHVLRIIREVLSFEPEGKSTNLKGALEFMNNAIKKKSIAFLISDFIDEGYEKILRIVGRKHDLIGIVLEDKREKEIPNIGMIKISDSENGNERWIDTGSRRVRTMILNERLENEKQRDSVFIKSGLDKIEVTTDANYIQPLVQFFRRRAKKW